MRPRAAVLAALAVGACNDPAWRDPAAARGTSALAPEVTAVLDADMAAARRVRRTDHLTAAPLPAPPAWAAGLIGRNMREAFPRFGACMGNTDGVKARYGGGPAGARVTGWGWDDEVKAPIPRVILVDKDYRIEGAGETGARRRDVPRVVPSITSDFTGWEAVTGLASGPLDAYGVKADGHTLCKLGHLEL